MELLQNYNPNSSISSKKFHLLLIEKGDTLRTITNKLHNIGVIKNRGVFELFARLSNYEKSIKYGHYIISNESSIKKILHKLNSGEVIQNRITIPEGMTNSRVLEIIKKNEFLSGDIEFSDLPVEGYLAPDTYFYENGEKRKELINRIEQAQLKKINEIWKNIQNKNMLNSPHELIVLASIIEKESGNNDELNLISSVMHNRLRKKMRLQADPTVIYGITKGKTKLGRSLTKSDLRKYSEYNTYLINGLPQNPICNPGESALNAAANPSDTKFYYYVSNGKGGHFFSKNLEEHNKNVKLYQSTFNNPD